MPKFASTTISFINEPTWSHRMPKEKKNFRWQTQKASILSFLSSQHYPRVRKGGKEEKTKGRKGKTGRIRGLPDEEGRRGMEEWKSGGWKVSKLGGEKRRKAYFNSGVPARNGFNQRPLCALSPGMIQFCSSFLRDFSRPGRLWKKCLSGLPITTSKLILSIAS